MSPIKALLPVIAAFFFSIGALATDAPAAPPAFGSGMGRGMGPGMGQRMGIGFDGGCRGIMRTLTPEQHIMHFKDIHPANMGSMTVDAYRAFRKDKCDKIKAMTADEKKKYALGLQAKWDALPDAEKVKLYQQITDFRGNMGRGPRGFMGRNQ
jgi:hypothetical protein